MSAATAHVEPAAVPETPPAVPPQAEKPVNDNVGLSEGQKAQFPAWQQEELARMNRSARGNIMEVHQDDLEISQRILRTRQDLTAQLNGNNLEIINALVTEDMKAKIEHFLAHIHEVETGHHLSEEKAAKEAKRRMYGEGVLGGTARNLVRFVDPSYVGGKRSRLERVAPAAPVHGTLNRMRGAIKQTKYAAEINSLAALNKRIEDLEKEIANPLIVGSYAERLLRAEFHGLEELRKEWIIREKELRTQALLIKETDFRVLNHRWGFAATEQYQDEQGRPRDSLTDVADGQAAGRNKYTPEQVAVLRKLHEQQQVEVLYRPNEKSLNDWAEGQVRDGRLTAEEQEALVALYNMPEFRTYRTLTKLVHPEELRNWRSTEDGRLLFMSLSASVQNQEEERARCLSLGLIGIEEPPEDLVLLTGGVTYPNGPDKAPVKVVGVLEERQGDLSIAKVEEKLKLARRNRDTQRNKLGLDATGKPSADSVQQKALDQERAKYQIERQLGIRGRHLEIIRNGTLPQLQREWNTIQKKLENFEKALGGAGGVENAKTALDNAEKVLANAKEALDTARRNLTELQQRAEQARIEHQKNSEQEMVARNIFEASKGGPNELAAKSSFDAAKLSAETSKSRLDFATGQVSDAQTAFDTYNKTWQTETKNFRAKQDKFVTAQKEFQSTIASSSSKAEIVTQINELKQQRAAKQAEMRTLYTNSDTQDPPRQFAREVGKENDFSDFEQVFRTDIFGANYERAGAPNTTPTEADITASIRADERALKAATTAFDVVNQPAQAIRSEYEAADRLVQELEHELAILQQPGARIERVKGRIGIEEMGILLRAKQREVALCASLGFETTARLNEAQQIQCKEEAKGFIDLQKETLRAGEYGKKIENDLGKALDNRLMATNVMPRVRREITNLPHNALHAAHHASHWLFAEHHGHRRVTAPARVAGKVAGGLLGGFTRGIKKLAA